MKILFQNDGSDFSGYRAATAWLERLGFVIGSMQREAPIGILRAEIACAIAKWPNLSEAERGALDGAITWQGRSPRHDGALVTLVTPEAIELAAGAELPPGAKLLEAQSDG